MQVLFVNIFYLHAFCFPVWQHLFEENNRLIIDQLTWCFCLWTMINYHQVDNCRLCQIQEAGSCIIQADVYYKRLYYILSAQKSCSSLKLHHSHIVLLSFASSCSREFSSFTIPPMLYNFSSLPAPLPAAPIVRINNTDAKNKPAALLFFCFLKEPLIVESRHRKPASEHRFETEQEINNGANGLVCFSVTALFFCQIWLYDFSFFPQQLYFCCNLGLHYSLDSGSQP